MYPDCFRPSFRPAICWRNAALPEGVKNPTTGIVGCCARAMGGQKATALPRNVMNSRRLIASPEAHVRTTYRIEHSHIIGRGMAGGVIDLPSNERLDRALEVQRETVHDQPTHVLQLRAVAPDDRGRAIAHLYVSLPGLPAPHRSRDEQSGALSAGAGFHRRRGRGVDADG